MTNYKRSGFKMKGYSYPGTSPMKGKRKQADLAAAAERSTLAQDKTTEFGDMKMKSSSILKRAPLKQLNEVIKTVAEEGTKSFGKELGEQAAKAGVDAAVGLAGKGVEALAKGKKKTPKKTADQSNFANIKFGR